MLRAIGLGALALAVHWQLTSWLVGPNCGWLFFVVVLKVVGLISILGLLLLLFLFDFATFTPFKPAIKRSRSLGNRRWNAAAKRAVREGVVDAVVIGSGQVIPALGTRLATHPRSPGGAFAEAS